MLLTERSLRKIIREVISTSLREEADPATKQSKKVTPSDFPEGTVVGKQKIGEKLYVMARSPGIDVKTGVAKAKEAAKKWLDNQFISGHKLDTLEGADNSGTDADSKAPYWYIAQIRKVEKSDQEKN